MLVKANTSICYLFVVDHVVCKVWISGPRAQASECHDLAAAVADRTSRWARSPLNQPKSFVPEQLPNVAQGYYTRCLQARLKACGGVATPSGMLPDIRSIDDLVHEIEGIQHGTDARASEKQPKALRPH